MTLEELFKTLVWDALVEAALKKLFAAVPFLSWGPFSYVINKLVLKYSAELFSLVKDFIDLQKIAYKNKGLEKEFNKASTHLRVVAINSGIDSQAFQEARNENKKRLSDFINLSGAV